MTFSRFVLLFIFILYTGCGYTQNGPLKITEKGMVVSADKIASAVGLSILKKGGNSVDAAVAVGFALAVTYPVAGNLGGGGYMVIQFPDGKSTTIDYREAAPFASFRDMYLDSLGEFVPEKSQVGALSAGVPGSVAGLLYALQKYGKMKLSDVIQPAINLAADGFQLPVNTANSFKNNHSELSQFPSTARVFYKQNQFYIPGEIFKQPDLAKTLERIKQNGAAGFYEGETAEYIVSTMKEHGGIMTADDLRRYKPIEREPLIGSFKGYTVVSMPPSSSGGVTLLSILNILENFNFTKDEWGSSRYIHYLVEAMKVAYADRAEHLGDPDFYPVPLKGLLAKSYAANRAKNITGFAAKPDDVRPGNFESEQTTHYSVYDQSGMAVSVTTTINSGYGSKLVVEGAGFLLNNEMDDFSAKPGVPNQFGLIGNEANSIQPFKRMLSSMTPTIVLKSGNPWLIIGTPGGSTIITGVAQVILNAMLFDMDLREAIDAPRIHHQWIPDEIFYEKNAIVSDVKENLIKRGHILGRERALNLMEGIMIDRYKNKIYGYSDSRGHGSAEGY